MRLVCPNCDATYEVDASVIPENGRDVQCSNCGHTWFQASPAAAAARAEEAALFDPPAAAEQPAPRSPPAINPAINPAVPQRGLDGSVLAVLREEARARRPPRRAETGAPIETQTEMGLTPSVTPPPAPPPEATVPPPPAVLPS